MTVPETIYRINEKDQIIFVNGQFSESALANDVPELAGTSILNRDFWDFITDDTTRYLYAQLVKRVREGHRVHFEFRCDSPDVRRDVEMKISLCPNGEVEFEVTVLSATGREPQDLLNMQVKRSDDLILACSWCNRIKLHDVTWVEIDEAIGKLGAFEGDALPRLSHGICKDCLTKMTKVLVATA